MREGDPLDGYRGTGIPRSREKRDLDDDQSKLYERYILGHAAERFMSGIATAADCAAVAREIVEKLEAEVRAGMMALLANGDLTTEAAKSAHLEARAAARALALLNDMILSGKTAGRELEEAS